ncbi:hypothetical protein OROMI_007414 [Orobanche minor]
MIEVAHCRAIWDGRHNFQVKWRGIGYCVNLQQQTCSCRVWDLTGIPCSHAICAIKKLRQNTYDFVSHWFKNEAYMKTHSNGLEVLRGSPLWEEVAGGTISPPPIMKQLRGRPKKQRRREGWEGREKSISKGKFSRMTRVDRVMHCGLCRKKGHNRSCCPTKLDGVVQKPPQKKGIKRKPTTGVVQIFAPTQTSHSNDNGEDGVRTVFMPTPGLDGRIGFDGTPPATHLSIATVGSSQHSFKTSKVREGVAAPRRKK